VLRKEEGEDVCGLRQVWIVGDVDDGSGGYLGGGAVENGYRLHNITLLSNAFLHEHK